MITHAIGLLLLSRQLTKMWTQWVQSNPTTIVPIAPKTRPAFLNAMGIARIPVPSEDFSRCAKAPNVLHVDRELVF